MIQLDCAEQEGKAMLAVHRGCKQAPEWVACVAQLRDESRAERKLIAGQMVSMPDLLPTEENEK